MREETREDGVMFAVAGMSRKGKTTWVKSRIAKAARLLVWDVRPEYHQDGRTVLVRSIPELAVRIAKAGPGPARLAYFGPLKTFHDFAELAYCFAQTWPAVVVVEELADVSSSGAGRGAWGELVRKGLYYGAHIYGITQRPQEVDKTLWGNATVKHTHAFDLPLDCEYMGRVFGVEAAVIQGMQSGEYLERVAGSSELTRGNVFTKRPNT